MTEPASRLLLLRIARAHEREGALGIISAASPSAGIAGRKGDKQVWILADVTSDGDDALVAAAMVTTGSSGARTAELIGIGTREPDPRLSNRLATDLGVMLRRAGFERLWACADRLDGCVIDVLTAIGFRRLDELLMLEL